MATSTDDNAADGNLDKRNMRLIKVDHTSMSDIIRDSVVDFSRLDVISKKE